ncbi:hypothetical protein C0Q70_19793 [Pomacea canaliculata]|uniref:Coiled-coil domain-containing protein 87 n=1 Tax=Pomacea canaliculata TaxID=400727 RepID=A0A2T7NDQ8_POMCA|nr:hypothetical protein C0Q70_19793 [Pomacea canaliculata]
MPTSREKQAKRFASQHTLEMPMCGLRSFMHPEKENDLYPLKWPAYGNSDVQKRINSVLGPLSLFAPYPHEDDPEPQKITELERPITPINEEIKTQPTSFGKMARYVRRRIVAKEGVPYLSVEDQQNLAAIIMGEVNGIWPDIHRQIDDPFLSPEENKELNRRIAVHIVTVCEMLFQHYLHKALILNERGVFSGPANMSRLKAQLALDADRHLNVLAIRRYLVADMRGKNKSRSLHSSQGCISKHEEPSQNLKSLSSTDMIHSSRPYSQDPVQKMKSIEQDLKDIADAMPYLDTSKLTELVAELPERSMRSPLDDFLEVTESFSHTHHSLPLASSPPSERTPPVRTSDTGSSASGTLNRLASSTRVILKRSKSEPVLTGGETLLEELGVKASVKRDALTDAELTILKNEQRRLAEARIRLENEPKVGLTNVLAEDLKNLMYVKDERGFTNDEEDLPPLLQVSILKRLQICHNQNARHDDLPKTLKQTLAQLEEKEKQRIESEIVEIQAPTHPQPATVKAKVNDKLVVLTSDIRVSERVCLSSITLDCHDTVYNDLIEEIDPVTVKNLDKNLFLSDEIHEVYKEIMKTVPSNHLQLDDDFMIVEAPETVNIAGTMASATLSKKCSQRVINPSLHQEKPPPWGQQDMKTWVHTPSNPPKNFQGQDIFSPVTPNMEKIHEVINNPKKMSNLMSSSPGTPSFVGHKMSRTYASWLQWWKSTITSDDYMKYLSTMETDYLGTIFHFYNSDDEEESDDKEDEAVSARRRVSRRIVSSKASQEERERDQKLEELRAQKTEFKEGMWNVNSVMLGGLGKDPELQEDTGEMIHLEKTQDSAQLSAKILQERALIARQPKVQPIRRDITSLSKKTGTSEVVAATEGGKEKEDQKSQNPQVRLERVWNSLLMPDAQRLDMAIKYSCGEFFSKLTEAVEQWEKITDLILQREALLVKLEQFERLASNPNRFFEKVNGVKKSSISLLQEGKHRALLLKKIEAVDADIRQELAYMKSQFQDVVSFKGRSYEDKMKWDKVEMLYWLQEERKSNALRFESFLRHIPLRPAHLDPIPAASTNSR